MMTRFLWLESVKSGEIYGRVTVQYDGNLCRLERSLQMGGKFQRTSTLNGNTCRGTGGLSAHQKNWRIGIDENAPEIDLCHRERRYDSG
jgi:hypothetical protein